MLSSRFEEITAKRVVFGAELMELAAITEALSRVAQDALAWLSSPGLLEAVDP